MKTEKTFGYASKSGWCVGHCIRLLPPPWCSQTLLSPNGWSQGEFAQPRLYTRMEEPRLSSQMPQTSQVLSSIWPWARCRSTEGGHSVLELIFLSPSSFYSSVLSKFYSFPTTLGRWHSSTRSHQCPVSSSDPGHLYTRAGEPSSWDQTLRSKDTWEGVGTVISSSLFLSNIV